MPEPLEYDFISVGGGAAGYFGAIAYAEASPGSRVAILEKSGEVLNKVKISGGGRCNVTHDCFDPKALTTRYPRGEKNLIGPFHRWGAEDTVDWFTAHGVELKTESDGRMFPTTDQSRTVIRCLSRSAEDLGVETLLQSEVEKLSSVESGWELLMANGDVMKSRAVLLATGGTRNRAGVKLAGELGHELITAAPSLFTFKISDSVLGGLSGLSVDEVEVSVVDTKLKAQGPCLITHWGLSGPGVLKLSAWGARDLAELDYRFEIVVNWCAGSERAEIEGVLQKMREQSPKRRVKTGAGDISLPLRLWQRLVERAGIEEETTWTNLAKSERLALMNCLCACRLKVQGKSMNKDEFVTAGGVSLKEVNFKTMESRIAPGLYFAGEVLDIDGITGGFNFQAAWTTSRIAGESAAGI